MQSRTIAAGQLSAACLASQTTQPRVQPCPKGTSGSVRAQVARAEVGHVRLLREALGAGKCCAPAFL